MGQKVNSNGLRYGIYRDWQSRWQAQDSKTMAEWLVQDDKIRELLKSKKYKLACVDRCEIERKKDKIFLFIHCTQPGVISSEETNKKLRLDLSKIVGRKCEIELNIIPVVNSYVCARIVAREIADDIERRVSFRTAQKFGIRKAMKAGAIGIKTHVSGRLGGVEIARAEGYSKGIVPLSTLRADIDYALEEAHTTYGIIGVKVWINRGYIFKKGQISKVCLEAPAATPKSRRPSRSSKPSKE